ncbi:MAG TPA: TonB-dependent receptor [Myxococcota bacterium]|nr:TonB-dependent receptor [Myxococcota bacterium]
MKHLSIVLACVVQLGVASIGSADQPTPAGSGAIAGQIKDALDRPVGGVAVKLEAADGRAVASTTTAPDGRFRFTAVEPGTYSLTTEKAGFETATAIVTVSGSSTASTQLVLASKNALELGVVAKKLDVARNSITPSTGSSVYNITEQSIDAQPQGDNSSFNEVLLRAPGVANDSFGQLHVRGDHANLQYRINGVQLPEGISGFGQAIDPRYVDDLRLIDGALPAQYGFRTAGVIEIDTKNGAYEPGGNVSMYGGSHSTFNPSFEYGGASESFSYFATGNYLYNELGVESPTGTINPLHDRANQGHGFAYLSDLLDPSTRLSLITGNFVGRFQIPNNPGQTPGFALSGVPTFDSANLDENQSEWNHYAVLALQKSAGALDFQLSAFTRYTQTLFRPDVAGDLIFNGVASRDTRNSWANGLQGDSSYKLNDSHTLRFGLFFEQERISSDNDVSVFPADAGGAQTSDVPFTITDNSNKLGFLYGVYLQDEWRLTKELTFNYGLRYDRVAEFVRGGQFSPRINMVYATPEGTTLHVGWSRYFTPPPMELVAPTSVTAFDGTTNQSAIKADSPVKPERTDYYDAGITQVITPGLQVGVDAYYKRVRNLIDEGQFGAALILSPFNYKQGYVYGTELTASYQIENFTAFANFAYSVARGKQIVSSEFEFDPDELAFIANHFVYLDHDQRYTSSFGVSYLWRDTRMTVDCLTSSGLRRGFANDEKLPAYLPVNLGVSHDFHLDALGRFTLRADIINLFDESYEIRDGSGIGVGAPQFGARRSYFAGISKSF